MDELQKHFFWKYAFRKNSLFHEINLEKTNNSILFSIRCFYAILLYWSYRNVLWVSFFTEQPIRLPLWPVVWSGYLPNFPWASLSAVILFFVLILVQFNYEKRILRMLIFGVLFITIAFFNSGGKINHNLHALLIPTFFFSFLDLEKERKTIGNSLWFASAIFSLLSLYFLTGFWKIARGVKQYVANEISVFDISAMANHLNYEFRYKTINPIAEYFIAHEWVGFIFLWVGILMELLPIFFFFKPKMHVVAGVSFILLHIGIKWVMQVGFFESVITLVPLLVLSPFYFKRKLSS